MFAARRGNGISQLDVLWTAGTLTGLSDAQLLSRFAQARDAAGELAFRALVERHGPMVLGVCRQILRHAHDADDAFQATFLVLVRKAPSIRAGDSLAPWLYSVACRTAHRARETAARHRAACTDPVVVEDASSEDLYTLDLRPLLLEELGRLPEKYRTPIVLCHLEGKTHEEAARLLCWPVGTVSGRLSRGRQLLRTRLQRRGITVPSALVPLAGLLGASVLCTPSLAASTALAATRFAAGQTVSTPILTLTQGVLQTMLLRKLGTVAAALLLMGAISGAAVWAHWTTSPVRRADPAVAPAAVSTDHPEETPAPPAGAPRSQPEAGSGSMVAGAGDPAPDCPLNRLSDGPPYCPISMAANALRGMMGHFNEWTGFSR
jgi:RNA polymerase sigma factor (sigma-70 family)